MQCKFIKLNNQQCEANAMEDNDFCFLHNPYISEEEKKGMQSKGGKANKIAIKEPLEALEIKDTKDVIFLISDTINRVRAGQMDTKIANCIFYGSGQLIKALETSEIQEKLELVNALILERKSKDTKLYETNKPRKIS